MKVAHKIEPISQLVNTRVLWWTMATTLSLFVAVVSASAQEGLIDAKANESEAEARGQQQQLSDYTFQKGDFKMLVTPSLNMQWNDNINLSQNDAEDDFIILPTLGLLMSYPLTKRNLLELNVTGGYSKYLLHNNSSSFYLQSGSGFSFDLFIKDIRINLHDQFSYVQDSAQNAAVANTGTYGTFQNSAGLFLTWDFVKNMTMTLGYDHQNTISTSSQFEDTDQSSELGYARVGYQINSKLTVGVEGSASLTDYQQNILNNNQSYSAGVYADWLPGSYFHLQPRVGYTIFQFQQTSEALRTSNLNSWYADLAISHDVTSWMTYSLDMGHEANLGVQSDINEDWYVRPSINWDFIKGFSFQTSFFYEHGSQGAGSTQIAANNNLVSETYDWYGGELNISHAITGRLALSLNYRLTQRSSSVGSREYLQDLVGIELIYHPL